MIQFNPNEHLMQIKNKGGATDYLPVQWRLVWFRTTCPNGTIDTEEVCIDLDREVEEEVYVWNNEKRRSEKVIKTAQGYARFRAVITDGKGGRATGTKSENAASFPDFIEKAETGAIGRALAALGYGTQFVGDEFNEHVRIVDSPVERSVTSTAARPGEVRHAPSPADDAVATEQQLSSICKLCNRLGRPEPDDLAMLSFADAKARIGVLTEEYRKGKASQSASASVPPQPQAEHAAPTPEDVERMKAYMGRVYGFKQKDFDARWEACKVHVLGKPVADPDLSSADLAALRRFAGEREKEQLSAASVSGKEQS